MMEFDEQFIEDIPQLGIGGFLNKTFKSVKKAVKKIAPIVGGGLGFMIGGAAGAGIGAGIGGLISGQKADKALKTALMGYGIGSIAGAYGPLKGFAGKGLPGGKFAMGDDFNVIKGAQNMIDKFANVSGNADKVNLKNQLIEAKELAINNPTKENVDAYKRLQYLSGSNKLGVGDVFSKSNLLVGAGLGGLSYMDAKNQLANFEPGDPNALNPLYYNDPQEFQLSGQGVKPYYYTDMQDQFGVPIEELTDDFVRYSAEGGIINLADGSKKYFPRKNGEIEGPGTGTSDDIPAMLSDGEFVFTAKAVNNAGGGNRREGAKRMYQMMKNLEKGGTLSEQSRGVA